MSESFRQPIEGFLLTRQAFDRGMKARIEFWVSTDRGPVKLIIKEQSPVFFIEEERLESVSRALDSSRISFSFKSLELETFSLQKIIGIYFHSQSDFFSARRLIEQQGIEIFESTIRLDDRFLMERFIYGSCSFVAKSEIKKLGYRSFDNVRLKPSGYIPKLRSLSIDIECSIAQELFSIGFYSRSLRPRSDSSSNSSSSNNAESQRLVEFRKVIMIRSQQWEHDSERISAISDEQSLLDFEIQWVSDEAELLRELVATVQSFDPDLIIGWNVINFDFKVLCARAFDLGLDLNLGRNQSKARWRNSQSDPNQGFIGIEGRVVIDGIAAMKAESYSLPNFSLESVAQQFLGRGKSSKDVDQRLQEIVDNFHHDPCALAIYNLLDWQLVWDIFEILELIDYLVFRSQLTGLELDRQGGSVAAFTNLYLPKLHRQGYVSPNLPEGGGLASPGGYVMDSKPGLYRQVLVLDFKSLYPSIIRTFKVDPLGLIEGSKSPKTAIKGFKGAYFSRDKHLLPQIITDLWQQRDQAKIDKDKARSQAIKIIMNSFYGVLGSGGCAFYDTRLASSITMRGHEIMKQTAQWVEQKGYSVIYGDTDSTFVLLPENTSDQQSLIIGEEMAESVNRKWKDKLHVEMNLDCFLEMEFETHFKKFLMPTIRGSEHGSKKRYAGLVNSSDGEKIVFKGLENVRTDWTLLARKFQQELYRLVFSEQDPTDYVSDMVSKTLAGEFDHELIYRKRLRRNLDDYVKNVPPHVKAASLAATELAKLQKPLRYQYKGWVEYYMTVAGPQPVGFVNAALDYQFYVDRQLEPIADAILPFVGLSFQAIVDQQMGLF
jgi:DNA polymerase-2